MSKNIKSTKEEIKNSIFYQRCHDNDDDSLSLEIDRYSRQDHGGGEDGNDWMDETQINEEFEMGRKKHQSKLDKVNAILKKNGFLSNAEFELGEKGHFSIEIFFQEA